MSLFKPDRFFSSVSAIDIRLDLLDLGLDAVLLDIDNTIKSRETGEVVHSARKWLVNAKSLGVSICLLSNNWHDHVHLLAEELELPIVAKAMKPLPFGFTKAMKIIGSNASSSVAVGDQLLTDVVGAHLVGMKSYMVAPLSEIDLKHTLLLRRLEAHLMGEVEVGA